MRGWTVFRREVPGIRGGQDGLGRNRYESASARLRFRREVACKEAFVALLV